VTTVGECLFLGKTRKSAIHVGLRDTVMYCHSNAVRFILPYVYLVMYTQVVVSNASQVGQCVFGTIWCLSTEMAIAFCEFHSYHYE